MKTTLENLQLAYDRLSIVAEYYPEIKEEFTMKVFGCYSGLVQEKTLNACRTYGCLLGNIGLVLPIVPECFDGFNGFDYFLFAKFYFPDLFSKDGISNFKWGYLFSALWQYEHPTFDDAMARFKHFLDNEGNIGEWQNDYTILLP